ncbi:piggyBac transposable element-derived protein 4-like isoform X5 [Salarias fasciatus]|uniref:piggyBac transposable element-derived protein 4-like isoform X5 n=1 Tax=Salarias fasciatus TaxID=181472 RepID=UPI0011770103|nr:piggyBac transposable element-derived protein 4-like isoform X5 [Salarias fasciatus]
MEAARSGVVVSHGGNVSPPAAAMGSVQALREFIGQRLAAASGEIFTAFERTVVQYKEEIERQRRLLEINWRPQDNFQRTESPQQHIGEQKTSSSLEQEEHEAPHIKEEEDLVAVTVTDGEGDNSHHSVRDLTTQRLTAAAEEIFTLFQQAIIQYEEEIDRQRRLLEINWNPQIKSPGTETPQQHGWKEEQLFGQERSSQLEEAEPLQLKEEQEESERLEQEPCSSQEGDPLTLKMETQPSTATSTEEDSDLCDPEADGEQLHYDMEGTKRQRRHTHAEALELILADMDPHLSEGEEVNLRLSSDSELSSDEETAPSPLEKRARLETDRTETAKDGTVWREEPVGRPLHFTPIEAHATDGEPAAEARGNVGSRLQSFLHFITPKMLRVIQQWTNQHARETEDENWSVTLHELMAFIAIVILRGMTKLPSMRDYWSEDLGNKKIMEIMSRSRFEDIMRHLRFDDKSTRKQRVQTDKFAAISSVWESFVTNCITSYSPGRHISVDAQLFPSKTRCPFLQYISTNPDKFGIKFWLACDLKSKYICNVLPDLGKDPSRPGGETLSEDVVMRLMEPFLDKGRNVTTDNFFTSLSLAQRLLSRNTTLLGTVNKTRQEIPQSARQTDLKQFSTRVFSIAGATLTVYAPKRKKSVCLLSSMHSEVQTENTAKRKPNTVTLYNTTKCDVDAMDQMLREYTVRRGTQRWPVAVFYNMIDMAALNAHVLRQACTGEKDRRVDFLVKLAKELANSYVSAKQAQKEQSLRQQPSTPTPGRRAKRQVKKNCNSNPATMRCVGCYKYTCGQCKKETPWLCGNCPATLEYMHTHTVC